ncbi:hypothetical protein G3N55_06585, partial [Dissulfurirhabdus thermomarina]
TATRVGRGLLELAAPPSLAVVPLGTGNDLARSLGWLRVWRAGGLEAFWAGVAAGRVAALDVWQFGAGRPFLCYASFGLDARVVEGFSRGRGSGPRWLHNLRYLAHGLRQAMAFPGPRSALRLELRGAGRREGSRVTAEPAVLLAGNIDSYAGGARLARDAHWGDGLIEIYLFSTVAAYVRFVLAARLPRFRAPECSFRARGVEIRGTGPFPVQVDGEWAGRLYPDGAFTIEPVRALPVLVPPADFAVREFTGVRWTAPAPVHPPVPTTFGE